MAKRPTIEQITAAVVAAGATPEQGAASATAITAYMAQSPDANDYLAEFNNRIVQRWNDVHSNATIYDRFKKDTDAPTLQAVVYERIAPVDFSFKTDITELAADEGTETRKIPKIHSILKSLNMQQRFKTTSSKIEIDKIQAGQSVSVDNVVQNLGASYSDDRTERFIALVDGIDSNKTGDEINTMTALTDVSKFIQKLKYYSFKFKEKRTDKYNAFTLPSDPTAKSDTKMYADERPVCFIDPQRLYQIEGDYYATLFQIEQAVPDVDFVLVDGLTANKFAVLCDPRVIEWSDFNFEIRSEQLRGRESGELNHYLFAKDIMGSYNCFNRVIFRTEAATQGASVKMTTAQKKAAAAQAAADAAAAEQAAADAIEDAEAIVASGSKATS